MWLLQKAFSTDVSSSTVFGGLYSVAITDAPLNSLLREISQQLLVNEHELNFSIRRYLYNTDEKKRLSVQLLLHEPTC